ncbi:homeobox protein Mohawk, partial [Asbolus verrucosus]
MDTRISESIRERSRRPIRNKRYTRRAYGEDKRPPKRLFTPEIKRFLKDWLVRRRENPYPNRDEKKNLAIQTGLTYIQVCNWFANWRRKLKNAGKEPQRKTWGDLIKSYNSQVQGNVEHFSICSDDSIWEEPETSSGCDYEKPEETTNQPDHSYTTFTEHPTNNNDIQNQCYFISSTTETETEPNPFSQSTNKYKNHIMEKYLRDCQKPEYNETKVDEEMTKPSMISKWLESAVNFRPSENNYLHWTFSKNQKKKKKTVVAPPSQLYQIHGREELDAAEALTRLASAKSFK